MGQGATVQIRTYTTYILSLPFTSMPFTLAWHLVVIVDLKYHRQFLV